MGLHDGFSPLVVVPNGDGYVWVYVEMRRVNEAIILKRHSIPKGGGTFTRFERENRVQ